MRSKSACDVGRRRLRAGLRKGKSDAIALVLKYPDGDPLIAQACKLIAEQVASLNTGVTLKLKAVDADKLPGNPHHGLRACVLALRLPGRLVQSGRIARPIRAWAGRPQFHGLCSAL